MSQNYGLNDKIDFDLVPVESEIIMNGRSWDTGDVPTSVYLNVEYYEVKGKDKEIIKVKIVLDDVKNSKKLENGLYSFWFRFKPVDWVAGFNYNALRFEEYCFILFVYSGFVISFIVFLGLASFLLFPKRFKIGFLGYLAKQLYNCFIGFTMAFVPYLTAITSLYLILHYSRCLDSEVGNYNDTVPVTDTSTERVLLYRAGRFGTGLFVIGLCCVKWSVDLGVPVIDSKGFGFENEKKQQQAQDENSINQGPLLMWVMICIGLNLVIDGIGQLPAYTTNFYIILPVLLSIELIFSFTCLVSTKDFFHVVFFKTGMKIAAFWMVLNSRNLISAVGGFVVIFLFRVFYVVFIEKFYNFYVLNWVLKYFRKIDFSFENLTEKQILFVNSVSGINEQSGCLVALFLYPVFTVGVYFYYENMGFRMVKEHFFVLFVFSLYFLALEPFTMFSVNLVKSSREGNYDLPEVYKGLMDIYYKKHKV